MSGRPRRKKLMCCEMSRDVPGSMPDPSLGGQPRDRDPTTRLRGVPRSADPLAPGLPGSPLERPEPRPPTRRINGPVMITTSLELAFPRSSCQGCTGFAGDRVHRGEPLLLGVDKEYQISYRPQATFP